MPDVGGRPRIIPSPEEFDRRVDAYVADCKANSEPILLTGMILALGLSSRTSLDEYANYEGFSDSVKRAKAIVEHAYERKLATGEIQAAGPIFALKNFGWKDQRDVALGNADDKPFQTESTVTLAPDEAYKRMLEGG